MVRYSQYHQPWDPPHLITPPLHQEPSHIALSSTLLEPSLGPNNLLELYLEKEYISLKEPIIIIDIINPPQSFHQQGTLLLSTSLNLEEIEHCK